ncbi:MAG: O-antigen ligase family protein [Anaerolineae bacterium]|nr:O-antigen ligase family protein [Anaerolineae bacterium]
MTPSQRWLTVSRVGFSLSWLLVVALPISLKQGLMTFLPLFTFTTSAQDYRAGALLILPVITALTALVGWSLARPPQRWRWGTWSVTLPVLALGLLALVRSWPIHRVGVLAVSVVCIALFWGSYAYTLQNWPVTWAVTAFAVLALLHGAVALAQFARQGPVGLTFLGEAAILDPEIHGVSVIEVAGQRWLRAYGLLPHPNSLGGLMGLSLLTCLGTLLQAPRHRWWLWGAVAMASIGLFLSFSRSAWLGTTLGLLYLAGVMRFAHRIPWQDKRVHWAIAAVMLGLTLTGVLFGDLLRTRLWRPDSLLEANSIHERLRDIGQAWMLIRHQPLTGVGTGYYVDALWAWANATGRSFPAFQEVHNVPLLMAAEMGLTGSALWLWLVLAPPLSLVWHARKAPISPTHAAWAAAFLLWFTVGMLDCYPQLLSFQSAAMLGTLCAVWANFHDGGETTREI